MKSKTKFTELSLALIAFYRKNPLIAVEDLLMIDLAPAQAVIIEDMWFKPNVLVSACRGTGKSFLLSVFAVLRGLLYPGDRIGIISSSFRQSKNTFMEVKRRWEESPILREACEKRPTFGADMCYLEFRRPNNGQASVVQALPLGDGSQIRGARFYCILLDEMVQIEDSIIDMVVKPMAATAANPMERVRLVERLKALKEVGADESLFRDQSKINKFIGVSSAFFTFNHMYRRIQDYEKAIASGSEKHAVHYVSYDDMPEGFLDEDNIEEAKRSMPKIIFEMEYLGLWKQDSDGIFKASLVEASKEGSIGVKVSGEQGRRYYMGVDPARSSDAFAITIIEEGNPSNLVYALELTNKKFPEMADIIFNLADKFNATIHMDAGAGGGGLALKDILANPLQYGDNAILDMDDEEYMETKGRKILKMFNPSPKSNAEAVYSSLNLLEQAELKLPKPPRAGIEKEDEVYEHVSSLYKQLVSIVITETRSGLAHFDVPSSGHSKAKKDLFSSFILASKLLYDNIYRIKEDVSIYNIRGNSQPLSGLHKGYN